MPEACWEVSPTSAPSDESAVAADDATTAGAANNETLAQQRRRASAGDGGDEAGAGADGEPQVARLWYVGVIMSIISSILSNLGVNVQKYSMMCELRTMQESRALLRRKDTCGEPLSPGLGPDDVDGLDVRGTAVPLRHRLLDKVREGSDEDGEDTDGGYCADATKSDCSDTDSSSDADERRSGKRRSIKGAPAT